MKTKTLKKTKVLLLGAVRKYAPIIMWVALFALDNFMATDPLETSTSEISEYAASVKKLLYAIAAINALVGGFNVFNKKINGRTRFQIEFCFRDSHQFTGLLDCHARDEITFSRFFEEDAYADSKGQRKWCKSDPREWPLGTMMIMAYWPADSKVEIDDTGKVISADYKFIAVFAPLIYVSENASFNISSWSSENGWNMVYQKVDQ